MSTMASPQPNSQPAAVISLHTVVAVGSNAHGQLGLGAGVLGGEEFSFQPILVEPPLPEGILSAELETLKSGPSVKEQPKPKILQLVCGGNHTLFRTAQGCFYAGAVYPNPTPINPVPDIPTFTLVFDRPTLDLAAGWSHSLLIDVQDGSVWINGSGSGVPSVSDPSPSPIAVHPLVPFHRLNGIAEPCVAVAAGFQHSLALGRDGRVWGWGSNKHGQLLQSPSITLQLSSPSLLAMPSFNADQGTLFVNQIACSQNTSILSFSGSCILLQAGKPFGGHDKRQTHQQIHMPSFASKIACGWFYAVALLEGGDVHVWGRNRFGQLGPACPIGSVAPEPIFLCSDVNDICAGSEHIVLKTKSGDTHLFGWNEHGNCANTPCESVPFPNPQPWRNVQRLLGAGCATSFLEVLFPKSPNDTA